MTGKRKLRSETMIWQDRYLRIDGTVRVVSCPTTFLEFLKVGFRNSASGVAQRVFVKANRRGSARIVADTDTPSLLGTEIGLHNSLKAAYHPSG